MFFMDLAGIEPASESLFIEKKLTSIPWFQDERQFFVVMILQIYEIFQNGPGGNRTRVRKPIPCGISHHSR